MIAFSMISHRLFVSSSSVSLSGLRLASLPKMHSINALAGVALGQFSTVGSLLRCVGVLGAGSIGDGMKGIESWSPLVLVDGVGRCTGLLAGCVGKDAGGAGSG